MWALLPIVFASTFACKKPLRPKKRKAPKRKAVRPPPTIEEQYENVFEEVDVVDPKALNALDRLGKSVGAQPIAIENPCVDGSEDNCFRRALDRVFVRMDALVDESRKNVRILQLGDSHIAADYITRTVRKRLQARFGGEARGYSHIEQRNKYGGRKLKRSGSWVRTRMVDKGQNGNAFGFSGMEIESRSAGASVELALRDEDAVTIFYEAHPSGTTINVSVDKKLLGRVRTFSNRVRAGAQRFVLPRKKANKVLKLSASSAGVRLWGLSFDSNERGMIYDSVGPVGADAKVYNSTEERAFAGHLKLLKPDLVVIMLGGNDALRVRRGDATLGDIKEDHEILVERVQDALPDADCMIWSPMDAGKRDGGRIVSKSLISEIRDLQRDVAHEKGCGFWDMYASMGGRGSIARWYKKNIINKDLIHPRFKAGELLGHLFAESLLNAYDAVEE